MKPLVIVNNHNSLTMVRICTEIADLGHAIEPVIVCDAAMVERCREALGGRKGTVHVWGGARPPADGSGPARRTLAQRIRAVAQALSGTAPGRVFVEVAKTSSAAQFAREINVRRKLRKAQVQAARIFEMFAPSAVLSMTDRSHDYPEASLLAEARRRAIKIILPYVAHYDIDFALSYRRDAAGNILPEFNPRARRSLYKSWSAWRLRRSLYKGLFFQAAFLLNAHRAHGTMSAYPWWTGNGLSDVVCVNSRHMADIYRSNRVPQEKIFLIGDIFYDKIYRQMQRRDALRAEVEASYGFAPHRKTIILSMPQFVEQGFFDAKRHWEEVDKLTEALAASGNNILISLHPRMDAREYAYLEEKYSCQIARERLADIIPAADVFVAQYSSTVVWAALCGIKTVVLNLYDWEIDFYDYLTSVSVVTDAALLPDAIAQAADSRPEDFAHDWLELSRAEVFDGRTAERYHALLEPAAPGR
jgi:hypothetical protein